MSTWIDVAAEADLFDDCGIAVPVAGQEVALFRIDGQVWATDNQCSHGDARLCEGFVEGHEVECPFHQGRFDVRTGAATCKPATEPVRCWPVKIEGGRVFLQEAP
jgi:naphthalene 1,2-dioxygenase system ferredoxin subunit